MLHTACSNAIHDMYETKTLWFGVKGQSNGWFTPAFLLSAFLLSAFLLSAFCFHLSAFAHRSFLGRNRNTACINSVVASP